VDDQADRVGPGTTVYTVGHGARSEDEFLAVLGQAGIELLVDVRRYPGSKRHPHFAREALAARLPAHGIDYQWWGSSMGGRRKPEESSLRRHGAWENEAFRAYAAHMDGPEFRTALRRLMDAAVGRPTAIMCAETLWWRCHRRLIADALVAEGMPVLHLGLGEPRPHRLSEIARVDEDGLLAYDGHPED